MHAYGYVCFPSPISSSIFLCVSMHSGALAYVCNSIKSWLRSLIPKRPICENWPDVKIMELVFLIGVVWHDDYIVFKLLLSFPK